jgi:hypothetical protein
VVRESIVDVPRTELDTRLGRYWYGQQEAEWIGDVNVHQHIELVHFRQSGLSPRHHQQILRLVVAPASSQNVHDESGPSVICPDGLALVLLAWRPRPVLDDRRSIAARKAEETRGPLRALDYVI